MSLSLVLTDIEWDTEGQTREECNLPDVVIVLDSHQVMSETLEEFIGVELFNCFGFNHNGFKFSRYLDQETHPGGAFFPKNLAVMPFDNQKYKHGKGPI